VRLKFRNKLSRFFSDEETGKTDYRRFAALPGTRQQDDQTVAPTATGGRPLKLFTTVIYSSTSVFLMI
jgi:hypothetical protein